MCFRGWLKVNGFWLIKIWSLCATCKILFFVLVSKGFICKTGVGVFRFEAWQISSQLTNKIIEDRNKKQPTKRQHNKIPWFCYGKFSTNISNKKPFYLLPNKCHLCPTTGCWRLAAILVLSAIVFQLGRHNVKAPRWVGCGWQIFGSKFMKICCEFLLLRRKQKHLYFILIYAESSGKWSRRDTSHIYECFYL